jgi:hypothetical protein
MWDSGFNILIREFLYGLSNNNFAIF